MSATPRRGNHGLPVKGTGELACGRQPLVDAITAFLAHGRASGMTEIRASLERTIDEAGDSAVDVLSRRLAAAGSDWTYYPRDPLARRIHHVLAGPVLQQEPIVLGAEHLELVPDTPLVIFANHLSYSDANAVEVLLQKAGRGGIADRLTVVAGPKVYSNVRRRFSSLCFGTIRVPQSSTRSTDEAVMSPREVALAARRSIHTAQERLRLGEALLIFPEGSRSRSGRMQPLLPGAARYLETPNTWVLPVGLTGTERLFTFGEEGLNPVPITLRIGRAIPASVLDECAHRDRRLIMDSIGFAVADLLPHEYRGSYGEGKVRNEAAWRIANEVFGI